MAHSIVPSPDATFRRAAEGGSIPRLCSSCGAKVSETAAFCGSCGTPVGQVAPNDEQPPPSAMRRPGGFVRTLVAIVAVVGLLAILAPPSSGLDILVRLFGPHAPVSRVGSTSTKPDGPASVLPPHVDASPD